MRCQTMRLVRGRDAFCVLLMPHHCLKCFVSQNEYQLMQKAHSVRVGPRALCCFCGICIMSRVQGKELRHCDNPEQYRNELLRLVQVLCAAHIFHKDIHGENVIVSGSRVCIIDYGDARLINNSVIGLEAKS
jgi:tRNA A-37 threonylcarbamoyl transferase component Bud32